MAIENPLYFLCIFLWNSRWCVLNLYALLVTLLFTLGIFFLIGILSWLGSDSVDIHDILTPNFAASFALFFLFLLMILSFSSQELFDAFGAILGSVPLVSYIADYGSFHQLLRQDLLGALISLLDIVLLNLILDLLSNLASLSVRFRTSGRRMFMPLMLTCLVIGLAGLFILNLIHASASYQWVVSLLGLLVSVASILSIPMAIASACKGNSNWQIPAFSVLALFSDSALGRAMRSSLFKALVFLAGIYVLEAQFGSLGNVFAVVSNVVVIFLPIVIMIVAIIMMMLPLFR